jgi:4-oxalocrotonate tautomerase
MSVVQVFLIAGRSDEPKSALITALTDAAVASLGLERSGVRVIIKDVPNTDFGVAGNIAKSLGRGIRRPSGLTHPLLGGHSS